MNYEQANRVKELASRVIKVLEGLLEVECPRCKGKGSYWKDGKALSDERAEILPKIKCDKCNGAGKIHYSHSPQVGEWCIYFGEPQIKKENKNLLGLIYGIQKEKFLEVMCKDREFMDHSRFFTPILEWEEIERVLEKEGYWCSTMQNPLPKCKVYQKEPYGSEIYIFMTNGKSRQEAVMKAVIEIGKKKLKR